MAQTKSGMLVFLLLFSSPSLFNTSAAGTPGGKELFQQHCSRCHRTADRLKTPAERIVPLLQSGTIRVHRFTLDEPALQAIADYIQQASPQS